MRIELISFPDNLSGLLFHRATTLSLISEWEFGKFEFRNSNFMELLMRLLTTHYNYFKKFNELLKRIELSTSSLPRKCSTPELQQLEKLHLIKNASGRRGSNPRPTAWKAVALPTELLPHFNPAFQINQKTN